MRKEGRQRHSGILSKAMDRPEPWTLWTATRLALRTGAAGFLSVVGIAQLREARERAKRQQHLRELEPLLECSHNGSVSGVEGFGEYAARQIGLQPSDKCYNTFKKVAEHYVRGDKSKSDTSRDELMALVLEACSCLKQDMVCNLSEDLVKELDACILSFFGFHWNHADLLLAAASSQEAKRHSLKRAVLSATRLQRYKQLMQSLGPQRQFLTLIQQLKRLRTGEAEEDEQVVDKEVAAPVEEGQRSPVILLMGGGMGAGKSTVRRELMRGTFWRKFAPRAVVVEADAFKENDVVFQALNEQEGGVDPETAALVHSSSVKAALSLLVAAVNEGRDIIFDGTMSWEPFVVQTVEMVRKAHLNRYRMGPGYQIRPDGSVLEQYWEVMPDDADIVEQTRARQRSDMQAYDTSFMECDGKSSRYETDDGASESDAEKRSGRASQSYQSLSGFSESEGASFKSRGDTPSGSGPGESEEPARVRGGAAEANEREGEEEDEQSKSISARDRESDQETEGRTINRDSGRRPSGHWAHIEGNTIKSNRPNQKPSSTSKEEEQRATSLKLGPKAEGALQESVTNHLGHSPGLVPTREGEEVTKRRPYRVEMVGVACDAGLSVVRGMRRAILTGRGVPVEAQLRSHKMFASAFESYAGLMDRASMYVTNGFGSEPELVALKDGLKNRLLVDPPSIKGFRQLRHLNEKASSVSALYKEEWGSGCGGSRGDTGAFGGAWASAVLGTTRAHRRMRLCEALQGLDFCSQLDLGVHWEGKNQPCAQH